MRKQIFFAIFLSTLTFPLEEVSAHGTGIEKEVGDYTVILDYDTFTPIEVGKPASFTFILLNDDETDSAPFDDVVIEIAPTSKSESDFNLEILEANISSLNLPSARLTFAFAKAGDYEMKLVFEKNKEALAETIFPITVEDEESESSAQSSFVSWAGVFMGLIIGGISGWFLKLKRAS